MPLASHFTWLIGSFILAPFTRGRRFDTTARESLIGDWITPQFFVYAAGATFAIAYLIINQVMLRLTLLMGSALYLIYYATAADTPLWDAIYTSGVMMTANMIGLSALLARNFRWTIPHAYRDIYPAFSHLLPGDFRQIVKPARRYTLDYDKILTEEGKPGYALFYIISGNTEVEKGVDRFALPPGVFVGEVAYMTGLNSSAKSVLPAGGEVLEWSFKELMHYSSKNARFQLALEAAISKDLALKVAVAIAPPDMRMRAQAEGPVSLAELVSR